MRAIDEIAAERHRQIEVEGWDADHDASHDKGELTRAAACYALYSVASIGDDTEPGLLARLWPWAPHWWKPQATRRNLVKAAALIVAEIERLDRAAASSPAATASPAAGNDRTREEPHDT